MAEARLRFKVQDEGSPVLQNIRKNFSNLADSADNARKSLADGAETARKNVIGSFTKLGVVAGVVGTAFIRNLDTFLSLGTQLASLGTQLFGYIATIRELHKNTTATTVGNDQLSRSMSANGIELSKLNDKIKNNSSEQKRLNDLLDKRGISIRKDTRLVNNNRVQITKSTSAITMIDDKYKQLNIGLDQNAKAQNISTKSVGKSANANRALGKQLGESNAKFVNVTGSASKFGDVFVRLTKQNQNTLKATQANTFTQRELGLTLSNSRAEGVKMIQGLSDLEKKYGDIIRATKFSRIGYKDLSVVTMKLRNENKAFSVVLNDQSSIVKTSTTSLDNFNKETKRGVTQIRGLNKASDEYVKENVAFRRTGDQTSAVFKNLSRKIPIVAEKLDLTADETKQLEIAFGKYNKTIEGTRKKSAEVIGVFKGITRQGQEQIKIVSQSNKNQQVYTTTLKNSTKATKDNTKSQDDNNRTVGGGNLLLGKRKAITGENVNVGNTFQGLLNDLEKEYDDNNRAVTDLSKGQRNLNKSTVNIGDSFAKVRRENKENNVTSRKSLPINTRLAQSYNKVSSSVKNTTKNVRNSVKSFFNARNAGGKLGEAIDNTSDFFDNATVAVAPFQKQLGKVGSQFLNVGGIVGGPVVGSISTFLNVTKAVGPRLGTIAAVLRFLTPLFAGLAISAITRRFKRMTDAAFTLGDELGKLSSRTGIAVDTLDAWRQQAELSDVPVELLERGLKDLAIRMGRAADGTGRAAETFKELGIELKTSDGSLRATDDVLRDVSDAISELPPGAERASTAVDLIGESGAKLLPFLKDGAEGLDQLESRVGLTFPKAAEKYNDTWARTRQIQKGFAVQLTEAVLPAMQNVADAVLDVVSQSDGFKTLAVAIGAFAKVASNVLAGLITLVGTFVNGLAKGAALLDKIIRTDAQRALTSGGEELRKQYEKINDQVEELNERLNDSTLSSRERNNLTRQRNRLLNDQTRLQNAIAAEDKIIEETTRRQLEILGEQDDVLVDLNDNQNDLTEATRNTVEQAKFLTDEQIRTGIEQKRNLSLETDRFNLVTQNLKNAEEIRLQGFVNERERQQEIGNAELERFNRVNSIIERTDTIRTSTLPGVIDQQNVWNRAIDGAQDALSKIGVDLKENLRNAISGLIKGTVSWGEALSNIANNILNNIINKFTQLATNSVFNAIGIGNGGPGLGSLFGGGGGNPLSGIFGGGGSGGGGGLGSLFGGGGGGIGTTSAFAGAGGAAAAIGGSAAAGIAAGGGAFSVGAALPTALAGSPFVAGGAAAGAAAGAGGILGSIGAGVGAALTAALPIGIGLLLANAIFGEKEYTDGVRSIKNIKQLSKGGPLARYFQRGSKISGGEKVFRAILRRFGIKGTGASLEQLESAISKAERLPDNSRSERERKDRVLSILRRGAGYRKQIENRLAFRETVNSLIPGLAGKNITFRGGNKGKVREQTKNFVNEVVKETGFTPPHSGFSFYANGGIVNSPTRAIIGEAGPEAVVPLPNGRSIPVDFNNARETNVVNNINVYPQQNFDEEIANGVREFIRRELVPGGELENLIR